jgi:hypothetical protein
VRRNLISTMVFVLLLVCTTIGGGIRTASGVTLPVIYVDPVTTNTKKGSEFTVDIDIFNVTVENGKNGVYFWEFCTSFNKTLLNVVSVMEGPWLKSTGEETLPFFNIDNDAGSVSGSSQIYTAPMTGVFGSGTLANVTFQVLAEGTGSLDLHDTILKSYNFVSPPPIEEIPHTVVDGSVTATPGHDVAVTRITAPSKAAVGDNVPINVTVENQGSFPETGSVTLYYNTTAIGTQGFTLAIGDLTNASFTWVTTGLTPSPYIINATATISADDDLNDNSKTEPFKLVQHDIAVTNIDVPKKVTIETTVTISVTVENLGVFTEAFNLTISYYTTPIGFNDTVELPAGDSSMVSFSWNTSGLTPGEYELNATATILPTLQNPSGIDEDPTDNSIPKTISLMLVHNVAPASITAEAVAINSNVPIKVKVENVGSFVEWANVSLWAYIEVNATLIDSKNVTLALLTNTTVTLTWDTTGLTSEVYIIYANATILPSPQNPAGSNDKALDDIVTRSVYLPPIPCDVNGDGTVNASDLSDFAKAYGSQDRDPYAGPDPNWNPRCDNNWEGDELFRHVEQNQLYGKIDVLDLFNLGKNYGQTS